MINNFQVNKQYKFVFWYNFNIPEYEIALRITIYRIKFVLNSSY